MQITDVTHMGYRSRGTLAVINLIQARFALENIKVITHNTKGWHAAHTDDWQGAYFMAYTLLRAINEHEVDCLRDNARE